MPGHARQSARGGDQLGLAETATPEPGLDLQLDGQRSGLVERGACVHE